ncbi:MAG: 2-hydroxyacyl-CoA dehydratase family protein [Thermoplasmata archaeon]|nr:2-hydroxyacyl-CoA dehydratase family protein [Thermoplasmata archaeon]
MQKVGITALVPPELVYLTGNVPVDLNNFVPYTEYYPRHKLCAWTAIWRDIVISRRIVEKVIVVAGGDCHNSLVDGQKIEMHGVPAHYFFYPFDGSEKLLAEECGKLVEFLGGARCPDAFKFVDEVKRAGKKIDGLRSIGRVAAKHAFEFMIKLSDLGGSPENMLKMAKAVEEAELSHLPRVALLGVPPIYRDFHEVAEKSGLHIVFDELPFEFLRLGGLDFSEVVRSYATYTFARPLAYRMDFLKQELARRKIDGIIHYTQYACHHVLEDDVLRRELPYPFLTVQGDLPGTTPAQIRLRLEAFAEMLGMR